MPATQDAHWKQFGTWVRAMRTAAALTQKEAANRAGIHEVQFARIEKGESGTKRETVMAIAKALGVDENEALNKAGYAAVTETPKNGLIIPPYPKRPKNVTEFLQVVEELGGFEFSGDLSNFTEDDFEDLLERIRVDVEISTKRKKR